jgi:hypothetical protein
MKTASYPVAAMISQARGLAVVSQHPILGVCLLPASAKGWIS